MESKNEKFIRLANARILKISAQIEILSNLSNASNYEFSEEEVIAIFKKLRSDLRAAERMFEDGLLKLEEKKNKVKKADQ